MNRENASEREWLTERFEEERRRLRAVAYRMLGSLNEADDAVQEAWLRLSRQDAAAIENLGGWLTTVVARICLNMLKARRSRREELVGVPRAGSAAGRLGRAGTAGRAGDARTGGTARLRAARHVRRPVRRDSLLVAYDRVWHVSGVGLSIRCSKPRTFV
jgi:DNA-directed RNA polymerase specialized sigma24 family protein